MAYGQNTQALLDTLTPAQRAAQGQRNAGAPVVPPVVPGAAPVVPGAAPASFARGGEVSQLPTGGRNEAIGGVGANIGAQVAGQVLNQGAKTAAKTAAQGIGQTAAKTAASKLTSFGGGAAGAASTAGIGLATGLIADKLRVKEDQPVFGGANADYLDQYGRRFEGTGGGLASNAVRYAGYGAAAGPIGMGVGALAGLIKGAASKNAKSAYTDFRVEDASQAIKDIYKKELGRDASDDEVMGHLKGQGFDPTGGDRWVGEKGTNYILDQIRASPEAQAFRAGGAGASAGAPAGAGVPNDDPFRTSDTPRGAGAPAATPGAGGPTASPDLAGRAGQGGVVGPPMIDTDGDGLKDAPDPNGNRLTNTETGETVGGTAPAQDTSAWDTDGYSAPAFTPTNVGPAPPGWDADKWNDTTHQTPKYGVGRILSGFPPTVDGLKAAMPDIEKAYPGATFNGKDTVDIPGVGPVDVLQSAGTGGVAWRWGPKNEEGGGDAAASGGGAAPANALVDASGGPSNQAGIAALIQSLMAGQGASDQQSLTKLLLNQVRG